MLQLQQLFFKKGEYLKNKNFLLNLSDLFFVFFELKAFLAKPFSKTLSAS